MRSGLRFCDKLAVIDAHAAGQTEPVRVQRVGPDMVFGRLWETLQLERLVFGVNVALNRFVGRMILSIQLAGSALQGGRQATEGRRIPSCSQ
jgi:hypothetical protein